MPNFPTSLDALANPTATTRRNDAGYELHAVISTLNDIVEALEAKLGIGASVPSAGTVLHGTGSGVSAFSPIAASDLASGTVTMVKLAEVTLAAPAAAIDFTNLPQTYRQLMLWLSSRNTAGAANVLCRLSADGTTFDTATNYDYQTMAGTATAVSAGEAIAGTSILFGAHAAYGIATSAQVGYFPDYANTSYIKTTLSESAFKSGATSGTMSRQAIAGCWNSNAAIKGIRLVPSSGSFAVGSRATLYGLPA